MGSEVRITLQDVSKSYYSETAITQALRKINLSFSVGEFVAITGESGSGKSTLLNIIGGMDFYDEGEMTVDGIKTFQYEDQDWEEYRRNKIGYIFQDYSLIGHYSVLDNIVSGLLLMGKDKEEAKEKAIECLKKVGLEEVISHRASELSSGQKQRLSIARAIAKDTGIILADEPTGNLDSETGNQIIQILKEISKERLVIMVTHNYDQAEAYVTRKIRIHEGSVVSDVSVNPKEEIEIKQIEEKEENEKNGKKDFIENCKIALGFAKKNIASQGAKVFLFTLFLTIVSAASFIFIGILYQRADDANTKEYSGRAFYKQDDKRLVVKRNDEKELSKEDLEKLKSLPNIVSVDSQDVANDINFFLDEDADYKISYSSDDKKRGSSIEFLKEDRFVMSDENITSDDIKEGKMPQALNEIVLYSKDQSVLGKEFDCYFKAHNLWAPDEYCKLKLKVSGILKKNTDQVYFSSGLARMLAAYRDSSEFILNAHLDESLGYMIKLNLIPIINDELKGNQIRVSAALSDENLKWTYKYSGKDIKLVIQKKDEEGRLLKEKEEVAISVDREKLNEHTSAFMEVSKEFFDKYYTKKSNQASVYIPKYTMTDAILSELENNGFTGISTYRVSVTDYIPELVQQRFVIIGISFGALILLIFAEIFILGAFMKTQIKNIIVMKFIGARASVIKKMNYFEMLTYCILGMIISVIIVSIIRSGGVEILDDIMWCYNLTTYPVFIIYNLIVTALTVFFFNMKIKAYGR